MAHRKLASISDEEIIAALEASQGVIRSTAGLLDVSELSLYKKILSAPRLLAFFDPARASESLDEESRHPDEVAQVPTEPCEIDLSDPNLPPEGSVVLRNDAQMLVSGLLNAGIKPATMDKLGAMGAFNPAVGAVIGHSLRTMHQMLTYGNVALFEEAESIRGKFLSDDSTMSDEDRREWYKVYISVWNVLGKGYDRTMKGTVALVEMLNAQKDKGGDKEKTPGFSPLR